MLEEAGLSAMGRYTSKTRCRMTAAEIYESMDACMDACMEENRGKDFRIALLTIRACAARFGYSAGKNEDDILSFYFKMSHLGDH